MSQKDDEFAVSYGMPLVPQSIELPRGENQCKFNREVHCQKEQHDQCHKCGWNPIVDSIRKSKTRERMGLGW